MTYSVGSCWLFRNEAEWSLLASGYDDVVRNNQNFNSASSLYHEKVSWLRLVTCLLNFSRLQRCESLYSLSPPWDHLLNVVDRQNSQRRHWHIRYWSSIRSQRFALRCIWLNFSRRQLDGLWNLWQWKNFQEIGNDVHNNKWTAGWI